MQDDLIGAVLDQYQLISLLAQGPVARVYRGRQISIERLVVVKIYPDRLLRGRRAMDNFRQDAAVIARLEHINVVPIYAFGEHDGQPYVVLRYYEGGSLADLIRLGGPLQLGNAAHVAGQIGGALNYAHDQGVTHGNVKSSNILLDSTGTAYLGDFAIESIHRALGGRGGRRFISNPATAAPEQAASGPLAPTMDVYALGAVIYEMLTGQPPYQSDDPEQFVELHRSAPIPALMDADPAIPLTINAIVARALAKQPAERYQSALELVTAFQQAVDEVDIEDEESFDTLVMSTMIVTGDEDDIVATVSTDDALPDQMPVPEATMPHAEPAPAYAEPAPAYVAEAPARPAAPPRAAPRKRGLPLLAIAGIAAMGLVVVGILGALLVASQLPGGMGSVGQPPTLTLPPTPNPLTQTPQFATEAPEPTTAPTLESIVGEEATAESPEVPLGELPPAIDQFGVPMVLVPAGTFSMGNPDLPDQRPVHDVFVDAFYIDKFEVTNAELEACVRDDVCKPHTETTAPGIFGYFGVDFYDNYPAIYVSWEAAVEYCAWREARLPTEAEWEKAARWDPATGETYSYPWGNAFPNPDFANYFDSGIGRAVEVDSYPGGASPVGAVNMAGNVLEWVADWYDADYYEVSPAENPTGPETGQLKVLRGASFDVTSGGVIPTTRWQQTPNFTAVDFGFRCALTPGG